MTDAVEFARAIAPARADEARRLRHEAREWLAGLVDDDTRERVLAAVSEAVDNAVEHAYPADHDGTVELTLWCEPHAVNVAVTDHGTWPAGNRDALLPPVAGDPAARGRGIVLMHRSVDSVAIRHSATGTTVALRQERP